MQWKRTTRFQNGKSTATVRMVHGLQGMAWCPKPTPSAADEALQYRASGAPGPQIRGNQKEMKFAGFPGCAYFSNTYAKFDA